MTLEVLNNAKATLSALENISKNIKVKIDDIIDKSNGSIKSKDLSDMIKHIETMYVNY